MKTFCALIALFVSLVAAQPAHAVSVSATPLRVDHATAPIANSSWTVLVSSTVKAIKAISLMSYGCDLKVGVASPSSSTGSEVAQVYHHTGSAAIIYPLVATQALRLSVIALDAPCSTGQTQMNLFYN